MDGSGPLNPDHNANLSDTGSPRKLKAPLISQRTWDRIKAGAAVTGMVVGTVALCAASTFACAYAQGYGFTKGTKDAKDDRASGRTGTNTGYDRGDGSIPISSGFRRSSPFRDLENLEAS